MTGRLTSRTALITGVARVSVVTRMNMLAIPWVQPVDVANASLFLASDEARYITAITLPVDAGSTQREEADIEEQCS